MRAGIPQATCAAGILLLNLLISAAVSTAALRRAQIGQTLKEA